MAMKTRSTNMFIWDGKRKSFQQDISTLDMQFGEDFFNGITMRNPKTLGTEHFIFQKKVYEREELAAWVFRSEKLNLELIIWND